MFEPGSIVTLNVTKQHKEREETLHLKPGICGMVTDGQRSSDGNHTYTVNFGPYGGWYCRHNELIGDDPEVGWDNEMPQPQIFPEPEPEIGPLEPMQGYATATISIDPARDMRANGIRIGGFVEERDVKPQKSIKVDVEADIARRVKELQRGK